MKENTMTKDQNPLFEIPELDEEVFEEADTVDGPPIDAEDENTDEIDGSDE